MPRRNKQIKYSTPPAQTSCASKRRFSSEQSALKAADYQMLVNMNVELRVYKCDQCGGWHLTRSVNNSTKK